MSQENPTPVFTADSKAAADLIVNWLQTQGVEADIRTHIKESDGVMLTPLSDSDMSSHLEIVIANADRADEIRSLILDNQEQLLQSAQQIDAAPLEDMVVTCEACGKNTVYPGEMQGTVQECSHCGSYLDVPGGVDEFDWSIVDETICEDDAEQADGEDEREAWG